MGKNNLKYLLTLVLTFCFLFQEAEARKVVVSTVSQLRTAVQNILPGDTIEVVNGNYSFNGNISVTRSGTADLPVLIRAQNLHGAVLINESYFTLKQVSYITIEGFLFRSSDVTAIKTESCNNIRITKNIFRLEETTSNKWVLIGGTYNLIEPNSFNNRIDHNLFEEKHQLGNFITIDGSPEPNAKSSQYDRIDHNYFRNIGPRVNNGMEAVRVGWSEMSLSSGFTTIEYNLFENCDGDPEIISVKTSDNTIRYNTFRSSQGTLCLRHGNRNSVEGNFFLGGGKAGTGGVRFYGDDHKIFNNYFEGLTGDTWDAALTITNGDADYSSSSNLSKHFRPRRTKILFNTFYNNSHNIEIGYTNNGSYSKPPSDNQIANNIVVSSENQIVKIFTAPINNLWLGNIMYPTGSSTLGISVSGTEINIVDPLLVQSEADSVWRLAQNSPAVDSSLGNYDSIFIDMEGQARDQFKDVGADEFSNLLAILRPLLPEDVGPNGGNIMVPVEFISFSATPYQRDVIIEWNIGSEHNNLGFEVQRGNGSNFDFEIVWSTIGFVRSCGTTSENSNYSYVDKELFEGEYFYRLKQIDFDGSVKYSDIVEVVIIYPQDFYLFQNYPNPFNPRTNIKYSLKKDMFVNLAVYNMIGERILLLVNSLQNKGYHSIEIEAGSLMSSGVYFYIIQAEDRTDIRKMTLLK